MSSFYYIHWSVAENIHDVVTLVIMGVVRNAVTSVGSVQEVKLFHSSVKG